MIGIQYSKKVKKLRVHRKHTYRKVTVLALVLRMPSLGESSAVNVNPATRPFVRDNRVATPRF